MPAPLGDYEKPQSKWTIWVAWSAFAKSVVPFLIFLLLSILWFLLFDFALESAYPSLFPIADYGLSLLVSFIAFMLPLSISAVAQRYNRYPEAMVEVLSGSRSLADQARFLYLRRSIDENLLERLNKIIRAIPLAVRDQFEDHKEPYGESYGIKHYSQLPVEKNALERYTFRNQDRSMLYSDALLSMIYAATVKIEGTANLYYRIEQTRVAIANVEKVKRIGVLPVVLGFMMVIVWLFSFSAPWLLWGLYRWWSVLFMFITVWPALAAAEISRSMANPFTRSAKTWHEIDDAIIENAYFIDRLMLDKKIDGSVYITVN